MQHASKICSGYTPPMPLSPESAQVHQRDVFMDLCRLYKERKLSSSSDFEWLKQVRCFPTRSCQSFHQSATGSPSLHAPLPLLTRCHHSSLGTRGEQLILDNSGLGNNADASCEASESWFERRCVCGGTLYRLPFMDLFLLIRTT